MGSGVSRGVSSLRNKRRDSHERIRLYKRREIFAIPNKVIRHTDPGVGDGEGNEASLDFLFERRRVPQGWGRGNEAGVTQGDFDSTGAGELERIADDVEQTSAQAEQDRRQRRLRIRRN
jgi:hypothetical protein